MMRCIADPAADLDPSMAKDWPEWMPLGPAQADPFIRLKLGVWLLNDQNQAASAIISAAKAPRVRLAFLPISDAMRLMSLAAAWIGAPSIVGRVRRTDVVAARTALGEDAFAFAFHAALLPRPTHGLMSAIGVVELPTQPAALLRCGAAMFGRAMGCIPHTLQERLRLRHPASIWKAVADACLNDGAGEDAFRAMRRLIRTRMPAWSHWFN
ncbi:hypothetical protein [Bradyrhizobium genosp. P]|uniref:hypothetical protein n=1 Tax=Bradyrhizobium genosp. P TaxID=83641 RepID=UPI003CEBF08D